MNKLPEITAAFWFMKITATTLGETGGDWLSMTMKVGYGVSTAIFFGMFLLLLGLQLLAKRHHALLYWFVIIATSTAGTTMSDYMDRTLELGYTKGAAILVTILLCLLAAWKYTVGNVEVSHIHSRKAEIFYWMTILFSNTLGTAAGDFLADDSGLGFLGGWMLVTGILAVVILLYFTTKTPRILLFWIAFILTRPFGATFGDLLTKSHEKGGLDLGTAYSSMVLLGILIVAIMVAYRRSPEPVAQLS
ncbi:MAG: hypothetical protein H7249_17915 [Chitinophagaceae bacterium]|nr:hypothetical protein [Oligoflexus sp.]